MSIPSISLLGGTMRYDFVWYNIAMSNITKRTLVILVGVMLVLAPAAQASAILAPSACPPIMKMSGPMDCCKTNCDCTVKNQSPELSVDLPTAAPRFELSLASFFVESLTADAVSTKTEPGAAEESPPPKDPLYQTYSDYRL
jgi:hypothetical protein